jgi:chromosomal replication initiation ATPase DnaA
MQQGVSIFYTAHTPPTQWGHTLPDLLSRLRTLISQPINNPDDAILVKLLHKQFNERGLRASPDLTRYILTHVERSYEGLLAFIERVDHHAATLKKPLSRSVVKAVLESPPSQSLRGS